MLNLSNYSFFWKKNNKNFKKEIKRKIYNNSTIRWKPRFKYKKKLLKEISFDLKYFIKILEYKILEKKRKIKEYNYNSLKNNLKKNVIIKNTCTAVYSKRKVGRKMYRYESLEECSYQIKKKYEKKNLLKYNFIKKYELDFWGYLISCTTEKKLFKKMFPIMCKKLKKKYFLARLYTKRIYIPFTYSVIMPKKKI